MRDRLVGEADGRLNGAVGRSPLPPPLVVSERWQPSGRSGVFVEGPFGLIVGDRGVGLGVPGGALHVPQRYALEKTVPSSYVLVRVGF